MTNPLPPSSFTMCCGGCENLRSGHACQTSLPATGVCSLLCAQVAHADPLPAPSFSGPLTPNSNPLSFDAGPFGPIYFTGQISELARSRVNATHAGGIEMILGSLILATRRSRSRPTKRPLQFYVQGGIFTAVLGTSYLGKRPRRRTNFFGPIPVAYAKAVITPELSVTGWPSADDGRSRIDIHFQNINIERGLLLWEPRTGD